MTPLTFTYDLEDSRASSATPERFTAMTSRVLELLETLGVRGTFFVVGELANANRGLMAEIAAHGHELALHGWKHVPLDQVDQSTFTDEMRRGHALLEDVSGTAVTGFRAPIFSLGRRSLWALDALMESGFSYSSSVLPAPNPLYGYPGAPRTPFRWPNGLLELPCPVAGNGRMAIPYLGGVYLRYLPMAAVLRLALRTPDGSVPWIYCHPYDFDVDEAFAVMPHASWATSRILFYRRGSTFNRISTLIGRCGAAPPLCDRAAAWSTA